MYRLSLLLLLSMLLVGSLAGCDSQNAQDDFAGRASLPPQGFTRTNADGRVVEEERDEDDWRTAPVYIGSVRVDPAFPNPAEGEFVTIPVTVLYSNAVRGGLVLRYRGASGRLDVLDQVPEARDPGAYVFNFSSGILGRKGLHRLFIFDQGGEIVSYGDLMLQ